MNVVEKAEREATPWIVRTARLGFAAKAVVYLIIGIIAASSAVGNGDKATGQKGALTAIAEKPFGKTLLALIAVGLFGYMVWRILDAIKDASGKGDDGKGIAKRVVTAWKGLAYGALGVSALGVMRGARGGSDDSATRHWTTRMMDLPFGRALVIGVGIGFLIYAGYQIYKAWRAKLNKDLVIDDLSPEMKRRVVAVSRFGIAARAIVFAIIGYFISYAAIRHDPSQARGIGGALESIRDEKFGAILLFLVAAGMMAYAVYEFVNARYRRIYA